MTVRLYQYNKETGNSVHSNFKQVKDLESYWVSDTPVVHVFNHTGGLQNVYLPWDIPFKMEVTPDK